MVPDSADSEAAILGPDGVLEGASEGSTVIDMSSIAPGSSQKIAAACEPAGVDFLDAPVSGGEPKAIDGTLAIMVGGKKDVFERYADLLNVMGGSVVLCGDYGAGNTTKLANQIIVAANIEAVAEAFVLAKKAGLDPNTVFQAIRGGLAGSTVMEAKVPMMIAGDFTPGFRIRLHQKDLHNALLTGKELGVPLPVTGLVQQMLGRLGEQGQGRLRPLGHCQLHRGHGGHDDQWDVVRPAGQRNRVKKAAPMSPESLRTTRLSRPFRLSAKGLPERGRKHLFFLILCLDTPTYSWG